MSRYAEARPSAAAIIAANRPGGAMIFSGSHGCAVTPNGKGKVPPIRVVCQVVSFGFETLRKYREPHRIFDNLAVARLSRRRIVFTLARVRCGARVYLRKK